MRIAQPFGLYFGSAKEKDPRGQGSSYWQTGKLCQTEALDEDSGKAADESSGDL